MPQKLNLPGCVRGWTTAMMRMKVGDVWRIYVPAALGYEGRQDVSGVPPYSTLIFDLNLVGFSPIGTPVPQQ